MSRNSDHVNNRPNNAGRRNRAANSLYTNYNRPVVDHNRPINTAAFRRAVSRLVDTYSDALDNTHDVNEADATELVESMQALLQSSVGRVQAATNQAPSINTTYTALTNQNIFNADVTTDESFNPGAAAGAANQVQLPTTVAPRPPPQPPVIDHRSLPMSRFIVDDNTPGVFMNWRTNFELTKTLTFNFLVVSSFPPEALPTTFDWRNRNNDVILMPKPPSRAVLNYQPPDIIFRVNAATQTTQPLYPRHLYSNEQLLGAFTNSSVDLELTKRLFALAADNPRYFSNQPSYNRMFRYLDFYKLMLEYQERKVVARFAAAAANRV